MAISGRLPRTSYRDVLPSGWGTWPRRANREAAAKAICATCPVIAACRKHALAVQEPYGIWGGLSEDDREAIIEQSEITPRRRIELTPAS
jgi:hypothetical protein